jgi:hypothetical protein
MKINNKPTPEKRPDSNTTTMGMALMAAAMLLPAARSAQADLAPERGMVSLKYLEYQESQPGDDRIAVHAPSVMVMVPIAGEWSVSGTFTSDVVSGASPQWHTQNLTKMHDHRKATDISLTRYFQRGSLTVGGSYSKESDYLSRGLTVQGNVSTESKNTTFTFGVGLTDDKITPSTDFPEGKKNITDVLVGVSQVLTKADIAQFSLGYSHGRGLYTDPYKAMDERPEVRNATRFIARWNHHFAATDGVSHLNYRFYEDNWGIRAHTLGAEYVQPMPYGWTVTPSVRLYTQTAADFYFPVDPTTAPFPAPVGDAKVYSEDPRLSEFGAITWGIKVAKQLNADWLMDVKYEKYEQRAHWSLSGNGDPGLDPFSARMLQIGITRLF